ncbi:MAG: multicopper oxidase domain-containing protein [Bacteroidetes bacterium]|nr:multicopper oxidase domain-containing protein [Bacteroidota bacterium]
MTFFIRAFIFSALCISSLNTFSQNPLFIPDTLSGTVFNLNVQSGVEQFIGTNNTPTYGYNGTFLGPTLLINKGDSITINVTNSITQPTTVHWHGFHVAAMNDGGPHQIITPGATWSPSFKMRNEAGTFWYHPHGESKTEIQVSKGLAGMIIVRDSTEATYTLPRRYGVDDFPVIVQSKAFDLLYQFATATHEDSVLMVNGTIDAFLQVPQQVVRLRLLNGSADRTYNFGLSDNSNFYLIGSDGGLLSAPHLTNRVRLSTGERAEILINLSSYSIGTQLFLKSYASELPRGIIGADSVGTSSIVISLGYYDNYLNGLDFDVLRLDVVAPTASPVTTIPTSFNPKVPLLEVNADVTRYLHFSADTLLSGDQGYVDGPFMINEQEFHMDSINIVTYLNDIEIWELTNSTMVAHPFHIHDIEFYVLDINGLPPPPEYQGLKDVILVKPNDTVRFITQFTTFADPAVPYMYHCHLLHHEDDGMMGTFLVIDPATIGVNENTSPDDMVKIYPNPTNNLVVVDFLYGTNGQQKNISVLNILGEKLFAIETTENQIEIDMENWNSGVYIFQIHSENKIVNKKIIKQ